ncbi:hypothetical protein Pa4123_32940 [Phytohabitans aurantiacus]|uniref:Uncharacterized protein n=1 Tax=Phytohabitans aurantiacus TaxID=3016789 RepID=A0ABQ5QUE7_9ACTN|nr:hypothetical protein Pa4123_32940 [Phytohabitans aurantiacus]
MLRNVWPRIAAFVAAITGSAAKRGATAIKADLIDQGRMHVEMRSNRVRSPLIGVLGVATRRAGLAWGPTRAEKRSNRVRSPLIGVCGAWRHAVMGGRWRRGEDGRGLGCLSFAHLWVARRARAS